MSDQGTNRRRIRRPTERQLEDEAPSQQSETTDPEDERDSGHDLFDTPDASESQDQSLSGALRGRLRDDDIEAKTGNYLLSFGFPGSGKTTFQSFLTYYITHVGRFDANPVVHPEESALGWEPLATYNEWIRLWHQGLFPQANVALEDDIHELNFHLKPKEGVRTPLEFGFLEVSGELMHHVMAERSQDPNLVETLTRFLDNQSIKMILVLVLDPDHGDDNDLLFQNLFTFLDVNFPGIKERLSLAILISKPQTSLRKLKERRPGFRHYSELRGELCEEYVEIFAPRTYKVFDSWPNQNKVQIMSLHLGEVVNEKGTPCLKSPDYRDIETIFGWIYHQFTGSKLGPTWWQKALRWIQS